MTKEEKKEYDRKYYLQNREKILARTKEYHVLNPDVGRKCSLRFYRTHKEQIMEYRRNNPDVAKRSKKKYNETHKEVISEYSREYCVNNRLKKNAQQRVYEAIKSGKISIPEKCEVCGKSRKLEAHHADYSKPLEVVFMCNSCHQKEHKRLKDAS